MKQHIFNVRAITNKITQHKDEKNLYEKVNQIMKGAKVPPESLQEEIATIIASESTKMYDEIRPISSIM